MNESQNITALQAEIAQLKSELAESNGLIDAIREGAVDALVVHKDGEAEVYSIESADFTYRILIEKFGEGALSMTFDGLILYCNDYFAKLIGRPATKITGTYITDYIDSPEIFKNLTQAVKGGAYKGEFVLNEANGKKVHAYLSMTDLHPHVDAIGVVVTDLSQKIRHEQALIEYQQKLEKNVHELNASNTSLEQFIHVISHDIKEPLRKILTYSSHLAESKAEFLESSEIKGLQVINSSAVRLNSLVDDLVKYAFSATKTERDSVNLNTVVGEVLDDLELFIDDNKATISLDELPEIKGSKVQMRQLFSNLLSNAIKYSKDDVPPVIRIENRGLGKPADSLNDSDFMHITITDNGIGMEESQLPKIFTIFQRLHMRDEYSGNGIGLAICKKIMENHEGCIEVKSTENVGTVFHLYFPLTKHRAL